MNQKIPTGLGTAILLAMTFTAGYFVWVIDRNYEQSVPVPQALIPDRTSKIETKSHEKQETKWELTRLEDSRIEYKHPAVWREELHVAEVNPKTYKEVGHGGWYGYCAVSNENIDDFCEEGCIKVNENVVYDFRFVFHREGGISALAYTNLSKENPSICFELPLPEIWEKILIDNVVYEDENGAYDVEQYLKNGNLSSETLKTVEDFKVFAQSIKRY